MRRGEIEIGGLGLGLGIVATPLGAAIRGGKWKRGFWRGLETTENGRWGSVLNGPRYVDRA